MPFKNVINSIVGNFINKICITLIKLYQWTLSYFIGGQCRFQPTCSAYGIEAFTHFPFMKALKLTLKRISRCRPGQDYGFDPLIKKKKAISEEIESK